jgi:hypothetical protein
VEDAVTGTARMAEVFICPGVPYTCDGFDPADWEPGRIPDFTLVREWEAKDKPVAADIKVTCSRCGATYDRDEHGNLTHPEPECEAVLFARALR